MSREIRSHRTFGRVQKWSGAFHSPAFDKGSLLTGKRFLRGWIAQRIGQRRGDAVTILRRPGARRSPCRTKPAGKTLKTLKAIPRNCRRFGFELDPEPA
jgi:hypothetical protein